MKIIEQAKKILTSKISLSSTSALGIGSAIAGFFLCTRIAFSAEYVTPFEIYFASFIPVAASLILFGNDLLKKKIFGTAELKNDKKTINRGLEELEKFAVALELSKDFSATPQQILGVMKSVKNKRKDKENKKNNKSIHTATSDQKVEALENSNQELIKVLEKNLQQTKGRYEKALLGTTTVIDFSASWLAGFTAVYIFYLLPMVLTNDLKNKGINYPGVGMALGFALYNALVSLAVADQNFQSLKEDRKKIKSSINQYFSLFKSLPPNQQEQLPEMQKLFKLWKKKETDKNIKTSTQEKIVKAKDLVMA